MNVVITGASKGIGYEIAKVLVAEGKHTVFALSRNNKLLEKLFSETGSSSGLITIECDITNEKSVKDAVSAIEKKSGKVEVLINNAGLLISKKFEDLSIEDWREVYEVNVFGAVRMTGKLLSLLMKGELDIERNIRAHVVNISSMGGVQGSMKFAGLSAYSSSKGALITLTECMAEEFSGRGIRANAIALGSVETEMFRQAFPGVKAAEMPERMGRWVADFATAGFRFFNGKVLPVSTSNP